MIALTVDTNGLPRAVYIVRPLGMGADEYAVAAVYEYRFTPAAAQGHPVPVQIDIEVNFRIPAGTL